MVPRHFPSDSTLILDSGMAVSRPCAVQRAHIRGNTDLMLESGSSRARTQELSSADDLNVGAYLDNLASIVFEVVDGRPLRGRHISSMYHLAAIVVLSDSDPTVSNRPRCQRELKCNEEKAHLRINQNRIRGNVQMNHLCLLMQEY